jgi:carboxyl-terminal processing protease
MVLKDRYLLAVSGSIVVLAVVLGPSVQDFFGRGRNATKAATDTPLVTDTNVRQIYEEALTLAGREFAGTFEVETANKHAIQGMLHTLDPHSSFFDSREYAELRNEQQSQFYGIGVTINRRNGRLYILSALENSPAGKAGLRYGDAIASVDGKPTTDWTLAEALDHVRGDLGAPVELTVDRVGVPNPITFRIVRDSVPLPTIRNTFMLNSSVGYVALVGGFSSTTDQELGQALGELKVQGMEQLVLDLRRNPGGLLAEAVKVAQRFLPAGQRILVVKGRDGGSRGEVVYTSKSDDPETLPLVVLIDGETASASEVVTGALQDHDRALVMGETSFGKGLVQTVFTLNFNTGLTLTTQKYYTPTGRSIQRDYSKVSFYDYYFHRDGSGDDGATPQGESMLTDSGRRVYGGGGITPDIKVAPPEATVVRARLFNGAFEFARQLVAGQIEGLREYKIDDVEYNHKLRGDEYKITDKVVEAFRAFVAAHPHDPFVVTDAQISANIDYVRNRLHEEVVTAAYGAEAGNQIYILNDNLTLRALDALPQARELAENARALGDRN